MRANQIAIVLGAIAGPLIYLYSPDYSLLYTGLIGGTVAYGVDRYLRQRKTQESSS